MPLSELMQRVKKIIFILLILFAFYVLFYNLGKPPLDNWDEAWYGEVTKQILKTKDIIVLYWNREYFFEKPPLYMWLSAFSSLFFGFSEFSLRFTSALSGLFIITLVLWDSYRKWGFVPSLLAFATLTFNNVFIWRARSGNVDLLTALFILLSYFLILSKSKNRFILLGIVFALTYLTKESLVVFPLIIFLIHEFLFARKKIRKNFLEYVKLFSFFILIPSFWLLLGYLRLGNSFVIAAFNHNQRVGSISITQFHLDYFWYMYYSLQRRYFFVFLIGIFFLMRKMTPTAFLLFIYSLGLLIALSFAERNNNWYLIPSMPFWSLTIAYGVYKIINFSTITKYLSIPLTVLVIILSYKTFTVNISPILNTFSSFYQKESGRYLRQLSKEDDVIIRLDHLYPATIFYADRKVLSSPADANTDRFFLSRKDLINGIKKRKFRWLVGDIKEVDKFLAEYENINIEKLVVNQTEAILTIK